LDLRAARDPADLKLSFSSAGANVTDRSMNHDRDLMTGDDFTDEITQPLPLAFSLERARHADPRAWFTRLAEAFEVTTGSLEVLLSELMRFHDTSSAELSEQQLWNMRTGLLEIVDNVLPRPTRERARSRLQLLLLYVAPGEPS
jgi:hypothetical protein